MLITKYIIERKTETIDLPMELKNGTHFLKYFDDCGDFNTIFKVFVNSTYKYVEFIKYDITLDKIKKNIIEFPNIFENPDYFKLNRDSKNVYYLSSLKNTTIDELQMLNYVLTLKNENISEISQPEFIKTFKEFLNI